MDSCNWVYDANLNMCGIKKNKWGRGVKSLMNDVQISHLF